MCIRGCVCVRMSSRMCTSVSVCESGNTCICTTRKGMFIKINYINYINYKNSSKSEYLFKSSFIFLKVIRGSRGC